MTSRLRIIVTGLVAQHPLLGGVTWDYLQYVLGLASLGHDVYYFEDSGEWPYTPDGGASGDEWTARDCTPNVDHLAKVMASRAGGRTGFPSSRDGSVSPAASGGR